MKAAQISEYGDPSVVRLVDIDQPTVGDGQVVVEVYASSINPFDSTVRAGHVKDLMPLSLPVTLGGDIAGTVTAVGADVTSVVDGDMVYGQANAVAGNSGAFAEYARTNATEVAKLPNNVDFKEAASLPLVGVSRPKTLH
jgi:NADPH:quinone reductase-like Zn-dependent oxidoreductase